MTSVAALAPSTLDTSLAGRGCLHRGSWIGATVHAVERLYARFGVTLTAEQWAGVVANARAGNYLEIYEYRVAPPGDVRTYSIPMGTCAKDAVWVPMVVNLRLGTVVTVLEPPKGAG
jgi:hypothetical protein